MPDLVVLGPETRYPVRAQVVRGWDYEFVDLSAAYDIVVYRDVFGMLAHQIDDENIRRYYPNKRRLGANGPIRVTLVDYGVGNTIAVGAYGPTGADWSTTCFAGLIVWPASLGPADRPDFTQPLYQPLGAAHKADGRWVWQDAFVQIVPAGR